MHCRCSSTLMTQHCCQDAGPWGFRDTGCSVSACTHCIDVEAAPQGVLILHLINILIIDEVIIQIIVILLRAACPLALQCSSAQGRLPGNASWSSA